MYRLSYSSASSFVLPDMTVVTPLDDDRSGYIQQPPGPPGSDRAQ